jgi:hypothetical protein
MLRAVLDKAARGSIPHARPDVGLRRLADINPRRMPDLRPEALGPEEPRTEGGNMGRPGGRWSRPFITHHDKPVFHDRSGRRRRGMSLLVIGVCVLSVLLLTTLALALTGNSPVSLPGFPDATRNAGPHAGVTPAPSGPGATQLVAPNPSGAPAAGSTGSTTSVATPGLSVTPTPTVAHGRKPTQTPTHPDPSKTR